METSLSEEPVWNALLTTNVLDKGVTLQLTPVQQMQDSLDFLHGGHGRGDRAPARCCCGLGGHRGVAAASSFLLLLVPYPSTHLHSISPPHPLVVPARAEGARRRYQKRNPRYLTAATPYLTQCKAPNLTQATLPYIRYPTVYSKKWHERRQDAK